MRNYLLFLFSISTISIHAQTWQELPNAPAAQYVNDDIYFINDNTGWMVNLDGFIYKTNDGGNSWDTLLIQPGTAFRSIGFLDEMNGYAGNLGPGSWISSTTDTNPLYQTHDGGDSWSVVNNIQGTMPAGICGMNVVNDSVMYAVGRYAGPSVFLKTTDAGTTWHSHDMSDLFLNLIDVKFFSVDTGLVFGGNDDWRSRIAYTTDGGDNWETVFTNTNNGTWHWKNSFPSREIGYASIEGGGDNTKKVAKTTDGGLSWELMPLIVPGADATGVGFMNDTLGWAGFWIPGVDYETTDGGETWNEVELDPYFNRFRKVNETTAYMCGETVWKLTVDNVGVPEVPKSYEGYELAQNVPNPFLDKTSITYTIPEEGDVTMKVFDRGGRTLKTLVHEHQPAGTYTVVFELPNLRSDEFLCKMNVNGFVSVIEMVMVKQ